MYLDTGMDVTRPKFTSCWMTHIVVTRVEDMVKGQCIKGMKFFDMKCQEMVLQPNELLERVRVNFSTEIIE